MLYELSDTSSCGSRRAACRNIPTGRTHRSPSPRSDRGRSEVENDVRSSLVVISNTFISDEYDCSSMEAFFDISFF